MKKTRSVPCGREDLRSRLLRAHEEEGVEPGDDGEDPHGPDEQLPPERHDGGDLVGEHDGEERGEAPYGELGPLAGAPVSGALEQVEAAEEDDEGDVGDDDEGHRPRVLPRAVDGHPAVEAEEGEA